MVQLQPQVVQLLGQGIQALPEAVELGLQGLEEVTVLQGVEVGQALTVPLAQVRGDLMVLDSQAGQGSCRVMTV